MEAGLTLKSVYPLHQHFQADLQKVHDSLNIHFTSCIITICPWSKKDSTQGTDFSNWDENSLKNVIHIVW